MLYLLLMIKSIICVLSYLSLMTTMEGLIVDTTVVFDGGDRYVGEWPCGKGTLYSINNGMIVGEFEEGVPNGQCIHYKTNGSIYEGDMSEGLYFGKGRYWTLAGNVITGDFFNGTATGRDTMYYQTGTIYVGSMLDKKPHGEGMSVSRFRLKNRPLIYTTDSEMYHFYIGNYINGRRDKGVLYKVTAPSNTVIYAGSIYFESYYRREPLPAEVAPYDMERLYFTLLQKKPLFPSPELSEEQLQFIHENCRYEEWNRSKLKKR